LARSKKPPVCALVLAALKVALLLQPLNFFIEKTQLLENKITYFPIILLKFYSTKYIFPWNRKDTISVSESGQTSRLHFSQYCDFNVCSIHWIGIPEHYFCIAGIHKTSNPQLFYCQVRHFDWPLSKYTVFVENHKYFHRKDTYRIGTGVDEVSQFVQEWGIYSCEQSRESYKSMVMFQNFAYICSRHSENRWHV
jgi:hypothetical protein